MQIPTQMRGYARQIARAHPAFSEFCQERGYVSNNIRNPDLWLFIIQYGLVDRYRRQYSKVMPHLWQDRPRHAPPSRSKLGRAPTYQSLFGVTLAEDLGRQK